MVWRQNWPLQLTKNFLNLNFKFQASFCITNLNDYICKPSAEYRHHRRENSEKQWKNSAFGAETSRYTSKFKFLNSKFEFQASFCITNLKYHIYEASVKYGRRGGFHRRENSEKQWKTVVLAPKLAVTAQNSKFWIQNLNFKLLFALLTSNITYMKRLRSIAAEEASTDEKTAKIQWKTGFGAKTSRYSSKFKFLNSKFELRASFCITNLKYHIREASAKYGRRGGFHRRENSENTVKTLWKTVKN